MGFIAASLVLLVPRPALAVDKCTPNLGEPNYYCCDGSVLYRCIDQVAYNFGDCATQGKTCNWAPTAGQMQCSTEPLGTYPTQQQLYSCDVVACTPDCAGRECGPDGCGGSCGSCGAQEYCKDRDLATGAPLATATCEFTPLTCAEINSAAEWSASCCSGNVVFQCFDGRTPKYNDCTQYGAVCDVGYDPNSSGQNMGCGTAYSPFAEAAQYYVECPPLHCTGDCTGRECGSDGCVQSCGTCAPGQTCSASGKCEGTILTASSIGPKFCCNGTTLWYYAGNYVPQSFDCATTAGYCNYNTQLKEMTCSTEAPGTHREYIACPGAACTPQCDGRTCGPNSCGGTCGSCLSGQACNASGQCEGVCTPYCPYGIQCGDDGCGGSCGACQTGETCEDGYCYAAAGSCGTMQTNGSCCDGRRVFMCQSDTRLLDYDCAKNGGYCASKGGTTMGCAPDPGFAVERVTCPWACQPQCTDKLCGPDGCGGICGTCFPGQTCSAQGKCGTCQRNCINKFCGDDGCGGSCGSCGEGLTCDSTYHICVLPEGSCASLAAGDTCCSGAHRRECLPNGRLSDIDCAPGATCGAKGGGMGCTTSAAIDQSYVYCPDACTPDCEGKNCGPNGCNGSCGTCGANEFCNAGQVCQCRPNCFGVVCGDDGCGGSCGQCAEGSICSFGQCQCKETCDGRCGGPDGCGGTCPGCPQGQVCGADRVCRWPCRPECTGQECGDNGCGGSCGTCAENEICDRGTCEPKPPPDQVCTPNCTGRVCGSDGCGGSCGTCEFGTCTFSGTCSCYPDCSGKVCDASGSCFYRERNCGPDGCGGTCGTCATGEACHPRSGRCGCAPKCEGKQCGPDGCGDFCGTCPRGYSCNASGKCECTPYCPAGSCGPDGCGGSCGDCAADEFCLIDNAGQGQCVCKPSCEGKPCYADNGCGRPCGSCPTGTYCSETTGECECTPRCSAPYRNCGSDGCGGTCGTCKPGSICNAVNICQCVPNCVGKKCGPDGCGGTCGTCNSPNPQVQCDYDAGQCVCKPACGGRDCGDDGCGGSCGTCPPDKMCGNATQAATRCVCRPQCNGKACGPDGCGGICGDCPSGQACNTSGQCVCTPNCSGKQCGSDGCGGSCGICSTGQTCDPGGSGQCLNCTPDCTGRVCGSDRCGGSCGSCSDGRDCGRNGEYCYQDQCWNTPDTGCCWGPVAYTCGASGSSWQDCNLVDQYCGWDATNNKYGCIPSSNPKAPNNSPRRECAGHVCTPSCVGRTCGDDGCGGSCGTCGAGEVCDFVGGRCKEDPCSGLQEGGCCEQDNGTLTTTLFQCDDETKQWVNLDCDAFESSDGSGPQKCGWSAADQKIDCVDASERDDAAHPPMCPAAKCIPHCRPTDTCGPDGCGGTCGKCPPVAGMMCRLNEEYGGSCCRPSCAFKSCGDDGCGRSCGTCPNGMTCNAGACITRDPCEGISLGESCCNGQTAQVCLGPSKHLETTVCTGGDYCGWEVDKGRYGCGRNGGRARNSTSRRSCPGAPPCLPQCTGKQCGPDGCGGTCGTCTGPGETCNDFGQCELPCADGTPTAGCCIDNADGSSARRRCLKPGGTAGDLAVERCSGLCEYGRADGDRQGYTCNPSRYDNAPAGFLPRACPPAPPCKPQCTKADGSQKECGDDGCGGFCGACTDPETCDTNFECTAPAACGDAKWQGVCSGQTLRYCAESSSGTGGFLMTEDCSTSPGGCGWNADLGAYSCGTAGGTDPSGEFPGTPSCRRCGGKECGDDGCGGSCGTCSGGTICNADGRCIGGGGCGGNQCGLFVEERSCQCDYDCTDRGDCCAAYVPACVLPWPDATRGSRCGDNQCEKSGGEDCASCPADCRACPPPIGFAPPWYPPYKQIVAMAGTPAQHSEALVNPLDRVLPSPPPYPLDGLLAYVPRAGVSAGPPTSLVLNARLGATGAPVDIAGAQGTGIGFATRGGGTSSPNYGVVRVLPDGALPRKPSFKEHQNGGFSLAFWAKVPQNAPDVANPLLGLRSSVANPANAATTKAFCARARPRDGRIDIRCPKVLGTQLTVQQLRTYYGSVAAGAAADGDCSSFEEMGANGNCGSSEIQAIAEAACAGKASCSFNPARQMTANGCAQAPFAIADAIPIVHALCGTSEPADGPALFVEPSSGGNKVSLRVPGFDEPLVSKAAAKDDQWHHVGLTYQPYHGAQVGGLTTLYLDGRPEATTDQLTLPPFIEVTLGAARKGSLESASTRPSNYRSGSLAAIADLDELFVYDRALAENEIRSLLQKKEQRLLRVWPALPPDRLARTGAGISGGASSPVGVKAPWLIDPALSTLYLSFGRVPPTCAGDETLCGGAAFRDPHPALKLPSGVKLAASTKDNDIAALTSFTLAGWVKVDALPDTESGTKTLMRLLLGPAEQVALTASGGCAGGGGIAGRVNGQDLAPKGTESCLHNMKAGEWAFVAFTKDGPTIRLSIDGFVASTYRIPSLTVFGARTDTSPRTFEAGDGVELFWAGLFDRALSPEDIELARSQGPAVWLDGAVYRDDSAASRLRDFANFHHNRVSGGVDGPRIWKKDGTASTAAAGAGPLVLSSGDGAIGQVTVPAEGRGFRSPAGNGGRRTKIFSWAGRVTLPKPESTSHTVPLVSIEVPRSTGTGTTHSFKASLGCNSFGFGAQWPDFKYNTSFYCDIRVLALRADGSVGWWESERAQLRHYWPGNTQQYPVDVDIALSYDGSEPTAYLGNPTSGAGTPVAFTMVSESQLTFAATYLASNPAPPAPVPTPFFSLQALSAGSPDLTVRNVRFYPRLLSPVEMKRLTTYDCEAQHCDARGRTCVAGPNLPVLECGACSRGFEGASTPGGQCFPPVAFLGVCVNDVQCQTGVCASDIEGVKRCMARTVDAACTRACATLGRDCVSAGSYATCSTSCAKNYEARTNEDGKALCVWTPSIDDHEVCSDHLDCKSGACTGYSESPYNVAFYGPVNTDECPTLGFSCEHWIDSNGHVFECVGWPEGVYGGFACPAYSWDATVTKQIKRCAGATDDVCKENHLQSERATSPLRTTDAQRCTNTCSPETYDGKPLWRKAYRLLAPWACTKMLVSAVRWGLENAYSGWFGGDKMDRMRGEPSLEDLKVLLLGTEGKVTPAEWSKLQTEGVGEELLAFITGTETDRQKIRDRYGRLQLLDCTQPSYAIDGKTYASPFFDPDFNALTCAANKFPDGTICPPPNAGENPRDPRGDNFCESGFCARDSGTCQIGFSRLEEPVAADRGDANREPEPGNDLGPVKLVQTNKTTMEVRKVAQNPPSTGAATQREYTLVASNKQGLSFFGSDPANLLELELSMHMEMDAGEGEYDPKIFIFGFQLPAGQSPASSCAGVSFVNGEYKEPEEPCSIAQDPEELVPDVPQIQICLPVPSDCDEPEAGKKPPFFSLPCWEKTTLVGPVPITVKAEMTLDACIGVGAEVDSETMEPGFQVTPSIGIGIDLRGGVGGEYGPVEVFIGVHAAVTIVEIGFPIKWGIRIAGVNKDHKGNSISNMWNVQFFRGVSAELTVLKLVMSLFAEAGISIFKVSWDYIIFQFEGITFVWDLDEHTISSVKLDLEHPTADQ